jgi:hypothetical protein
MPDTLNKVSDIRKQALCSFYFIHHSRKFRQHFEQIPDNTVIRNFKYRCILVFVDCKDVFGCGHSRQMLNGAGYTACYIKIRRNCLAGLTDLLGVRTPTGIDNGARSAYCCAESGCQIFNQIEILCCFHAATARNNYVGFQDIELA